MKIETVLNGEGFAGPVKDQEIAELISSVDQKITEVYTNNSSDKTGQIACSLCKHLHTAAIIWSKFLSKSEAIRNKVNELGRQLLEDLDQKDFSKSEKLKRELYASIKV